jgi:AraC-like DNA-binding protein
LGTRLRRDCRGLLPKTSLPRDRQELSHVNSTALYIGTVGLDPRIQITLKVIAEHKGSMQGGLSDISRLLGLSETYLLRLFHREVKKTFREYLREVRMIRAAELIKCSPLSMKQIAVECGYSDTSNFYRDFKIVHAITPKMFQFRELDKFSHVETEAVARWSARSPFRKTSKAS